MWEGHWRGFEGLGKGRQRIHNGRDGDRFANCNVIRQAKRRPVFKFPENGHGRCGKAIYMIFVYIYSFSGMSEFIALHLMLTEPKILLDEDPSAN